MICKLYKIKQSKRSNKNNHSEQIVWSNAEEEIFDEVLVFLNYLFIEMKFQIMYYVSGS